MSKMRQVIEEDAFVEEAERQPGEVELEARDEHRANEHRQLLYLPNDPRQSFFASSDLRLLPRTAGHSDENRQGAGRVSPDDASSPGKGIGKQGIAGTCKQTSKNNHSETVRRIARGSRPRSFEAKKRPIEPPSPPLAVLVFPIGDPLRFSKQFRPTLGCIASGAVTSFP